MQSWGCGRSAAPDVSEGTQRKASAAAPPATAAGGRGPRLGLLGLGPRGALGWSCGLELWVGAHDLKDVGWGRGLESKGCSLWAEALGLGLPVGALGFLWGLAAPIAAQPQPRAELRCSAAGHQRAPKGRGAKQGAELRSGDPQPPISPTRPPPPPQLPSPSRGSAQRTTESTALPPPPAVNYR